MSLPSDRGACMHPSGCIKTAVRDGRCDVHQRQDDGTRSIRRQRFWGPFGMSARVLAPMERLAVEKLDDAAALLAEAVGLLEAAAADAPDRLADERLKAAAAAKRTGEEIRAWAATLVVPT